MTIWTKGLTLTEADVINLVTDLSLKAAAVHTHSNGSEIQKVQVRRNGTLIGAQVTLNFIAGNGVTLTCVNNTAASRIDITVSAP